MIRDFNNPSQQRLFACNEVRCFYLCCDGLNSTSSLCHHCDSYFAYCLRNVGTLTAGCPEDGNTMRSDTNTNNTFIDFSQNTVFGLDNPLVFHGLNGTWNVSIHSMQILYNTIARPLHDNMIHSICHQLPTCTIWKVIINKVCARAV